MKMLYVIYIVTICRRSMLFTFMVWTVRQCLIHCFHAFRQDTEGVCLLQDHMVCGVWMTTTSSPSFLAQHSLWTTDIWSPSPFTTLIYWRISPMSLCIWAVWSLWKEWRRVHWLNTHQCLMISVQCHPGAKWTVGCWKCTRRRFSKKCQSCNISCLGHSSNGRVNLERFNSTRLANGSATATDDVGIQLWFVLCLRRGLPYHNGSIFHSWDLLSIAVVGLWDRQEMTLGLSKWP